MAARIVETKIRKCGRRKEGGIYLIGGGRTSPDGTLALFNQLNPPIPYQVKLHRGPRIVDAHAILARAPMDKWWLGNSQETEEKKSADEWSLNTFGMTIQKRLNTGETYGVKSADEAMAILVSKLQLNLNDSRLADYFRQLTLNNVQELPRVDAHYSSLQEHLVLYGATHTIGELMGAQAAVWRIAYNLPPSKYQQVVPNLTRLLVLMNLPRDAIALQKMFR
jgi:hypothetical protein